MVALKLQQFQYNLKKNFLRHLVFPMLFGPSDGGTAKGEGYFKRGGGGVPPAFFESQGWGSLGQRWVLCRGILA